MAKRDDPIFADLQGTHFTTCDPTFVKRCEPIYGAAPASLRNLRGPPLHSRVSYAHASDRHDRTACATTFQTSVRCEGTWTSKLRGRDALCELGFTGPSRYTTV